MTTGKAEITQENQTAAQSFSEQDVLDWLLVHPEFVLRHAGKLAQPTEGLENVTPLHAVRAARAEKTSQTLEKRQQRLIRTAQANSASSAEVFSVVPALIRCRTLAALRKYLQTGLKQDLQVDASRLWLVGEAETATTLPQDTIEDLLEGHPVMLRTLYDASDRTLYGTTGKMMKSDALFGLADSHGEIIGLLALASQDDSRFHPGQGQDLAIFFGQVVGTVLEQALAGEDR